MTQLGDVLSIETHDGNSLVFVDPDFKLIAYGNLGAPPTNFITRQGYKQNSLTEVDYLLQPRTITVTLWRSPACDRQTYWDNRRELHDFLRPNRNGPLTFTLRTPDGSLRSIIVRADPGLVLPPTPTNNNWNIEEQMDFIAFDPTFFNSEETILALSSANQLQLIFPITFPITFGTANIVLSTGSLTYDGTWKAYPILTLTGPYTRALIQHITNQVNILMSVAIANGESRIIDLTPGAQSITDQNGNNKFSELGVGSDLVDFALFPDPEVSGGVQEILIQMIDGVSGQSTASLSYNTRFFAL